MSIPASSASSTPEPDKLAFSSKAKRGPTSSSSWFIVQGAPSPNLANLRPRPAHLRELDRKVENTLMEEEQRALDGRNQLIPITGRRSRPVPLALDLAHYRGKQAMIKNDLETAEAFFQRLVEMNPYDARGWLGLGRLLYKKGKRDEMRRKFQQGLQYNRKSAHLRQAWGVIEQDLGDLLRARTLLLEAVQVDPDHAASWVALGVLNRRMNKSSTSARKCFVKATTVDERNVHAWTALAELERREGNKQLARQYYEKACNLKPQNATSWHAWGNLEASCNNTKKAEELFKKSMEANPKNPFPLVTWAKMSLRQGRLNQAKALYLRALEINPKDVLTHQALAVLLEKRKEFDSARAMFKKGVELNPSHCPLYQAWASMETRLGNISQAREIFQQGVWAAPRSPDLVRIWLAWAILEANQKDIGTARSYLQYGLRIEPNNPYLLNSWATMEGRFGNSEKAREIFERAVELHPRNMNIWRSYEYMENKAGYVRLAGAVKQRAMDARNTGNGINQDSVRVRIAEAQPGDFRNSEGVWISAKDLRLVSPTVLMNWNNVVSDEDGFQNIRRDDESVARILPEEQNRNGKPGMQNPPKQQLQNGTETKEEDVE